MSYLADGYAFASRFDDAIAQYDRVLELDPTFRRAYEGKGFAYIGKHQYNTAIENLEKYQSLIGHPLKGFSGLGHAYALAGLKDKARECLSKVLQRQKEEPHINLDLDLAVVYMGLKEYDKAFEHLDSMYAQRMGVACTGIIYCIRYPILLEDVRTDPRFEALVEKVGLDL
jgi:tetratricopeptide (TPR) repeat protein